MSVISGSSSASAFDSSGAAASRGPSRSSDSSIQSPPVAASRIARESSTGRAGAGRVRTGAADPTERAKPPALTTPASSRVSDSGRDAGGRAARSPGGRTTRCSTHVVDADPLSLGTDGRSVWTVDLAEHQQLDPLCHDTMANGSRAKPAADRGRRDRLSGVVGVRRRQVGIDDRYPGHGARHRGDEQQPVGSPGNASRAGGDGQHCADHPSPSAADGELEHERRGVVGRSVRDRTTDQQLGDAAERRLVRCLVPRRCRHVAVHAVGAEDDPVAVADGQAAHGEPVAGARIAEERRQAGEIACAERTSGVGQHVQRRQPRPLELLAEGVIGGQQLDLIAAHAIAAHVAEVHHREPAVDEPDGCRCGTDAAMPEMPGVLDDRGVDPLRSHRSIRRRPPGRSARRATRRP